MTPITWFELTYTPSEKGNIRSVKISIVAETKEQALDIVEDEIQQFFEQNFVIDIKPLLHGFRDDET